MFSSSSHNMLDRMVLEHLLAYCRFHIISIKFVRKHVERSSCAKSRKGFERFQVESDTKLLSISGTTTCNLSSSHSTDVTSMPGPGREISEVRLFALQPNHVQEMHDLAEPHKFIDFANRDRFTRENSANTRHNLKTGMNSKWEFRYHDPSEHEQLNGCVYSNSCRFYIACNVHE